MLSLQATDWCSIGLFANAPSRACEGEARCACVAPASPQRHTYDSAQRSGGDYGQYAVTPRPENHLVSSYLEISDENCDGPSIDVTATRL